MRKTLVLTATALVAVVIMVTAPVVAQAATDCTFTAGNGQILTLDQSCSTDETLAIPDGWTLDCRGLEIFATDPPGGPFAGPVVTNEGAWAGVRNCTILGDFTYPQCQGGDSRLRGILFAGAGGVIVDNVVYGIHRPLSHFGCQEGNAIEVRNAPFDGTGENPVRVVIRGNEATNYQKNGITVNGNAEASVVDNVILGNGMIPNIAQNGIQFGFGATGDMRRNHVDGNWFTGDDWASTGLLVFEASDMLVQGNEIRENQVGVSAETWGWFAPEASRNIYRANRIFESQWGVSIGSRSCGFGLSTMDSFANDNNVTANLIANYEIEGEVGISVFADEDCFGGTPATTAETDGTVVRGNRIGGFETPIGQSGDTNTVVRGNRVFVP